MDTKLTLIIDDSIKEQAKEYAKETGSSLSKLVENYLYTLSFRKKTKSEEELTPAVKRMSEMIKKNPARFKDFDMKEEKIQRLEEKYMK